MKRVPKVCRLFLVVIAAAAAAGGDARADEPKPPPAVALEAPASAQLAAAVQLIREREFFRACDDLDALVAASPADANVRVYYAIALLGAERREQAREQATIAIGWKPGLAQAYTVRAIAAAGMGSADRARDDLRIARRLDPKDALDIRAAAEKRVEELLQSIPSKPPADWLAALLKASREGEALPQLVDRAAQVLKASNAKRRFGGEVYTEQCRRLLWALIQDPRNPNRIAACASFLLDELEPRSDWVESAQHPTYYRQQTKALRDAELALARKMLVSALALDPLHAPSLAGLARIEFRAQMWANAERYLRQAIATGEADRHVLYMMRDIMQIAAGQNMARSIQIRTVRRWEETVGNYVYEYQSAPTAAGLAAAEAFEANASNLLYQSREYLRRAIQTLASDAASHDFVGEMAFRVNDWEAARVAWEKAAKLDPDARAYRYSLSNAYSKLNQVEPFLEHATIGRNLEHTTAATQLRMAWRQIIAGDWAGATAQLDEATKLDAADARAIAYRAVIAEARGQTGEALALYRAALALEEARARQRGCSWLTGIGRWYVNDLGRAIELRSRIAELSEARDPALAAQLYLDNVHLESLIGDHALRQEVFSAMLPLPNLPANRRQDPPRFGELMRVQRSRGAVLLVQLGRHPEAAEHFRKLQEYDTRNRAAGAKAFETLRDEVWKSALTASAAVACFERLGDQQSLYGWRTWQSRARPSQADSRFAPTSPQPAPGARR